MSSLLKLNNYFFPVVNVVADIGFEPIDSQPEMKWDIKVSLQKDEDKSLYQVAVQISSQPESEEERTPYSVNLVAVGLFDINIDWPEPEKLLFINGAALLYGAAREFVITVTSRGPWPSIMLPAHNFISDYNDSYLPGDDK